MSRVLVTGANGFIGRWTLPALRQRGYEVHAITSNAPRVDTPDVVWHRADLMNPTEVERVVSTVRASHLLHLAWYTQHGAFWTSPLNVRWTSASLALLWAFQEHGGARVVMTGTCAEYRSSDDVCRERSSPV